MPPKQAKADPRALTLLFKKHKITILLSSQAQEPLTAVKEKLFQVLKSRGLREINGDPIPEDPAHIELGIPVDRSDLEKGKGWTCLVKDAAIEDGVAKSTGKNGNTVISAGLENGHSVAFRFREPDVEKEDGDWDVIIPTFDDEEEEL